MLRFVALLAFCAVWWGGITVPVHAQDKIDLPPRFASFAKNEHFTLLRVLGAPELPATYLPTSAFSANGKRAAYAEDLTTGGDDAPHLRTRLLVWDIDKKSWPREIEIEGKNVTALAISADGSKVLLAGQTVDKKYKPKEKNDKAKAKDVKFQSCLIWWDLDGGKQTRSFDAMSSQPIFCIALAPDEKTALTGSFGSVQRWDIKTGRRLALYQPKGIPEEVTALTWLADGTRFLAGHAVEEGKRGGVVRLWDVDKKEPLRTYPDKGEFGLVWHLKASKDGKGFAAGDSMPAVRVLEIETGKQIMEVAAPKGGPDEIVTSMALSEDGKTTYSIWARPNPAPDDFASARLVAKSVEAKDMVQWSAPASYRGRAPMLLTGDRLMIGGGTNLFETWSLKDRKRLESWGGHKGAVAAVAALPGGDILSAGPEGQLMTWQRDQVALKKQAHAGAIAALMLSPDRKSWLTGGADRIVRLWNSEADLPPRELKGHTGSVTALAFNKSGQWAASTSGDRSIKTWSVSSGKELAALLGHADGVNAVAVSPDDRWLASAGDDASIRVWPIKDGKLDETRDVIVLEQHKKPVSCLAFAPDGKSLVSGSQDQSINVWDWQKEKVIRTIPGHKNWVTSVLFLDDATFLTASDDLTICQWDVATGKEIGRIDFGNVGDCPRCLARAGADRLLVGTSNWLIYEFRIQSPKR